MQAGGQLSTIIKSILWIHCCITCSRTILWSLLLCSVLHAIGLVRKVGFPTVTFLKLIRDLIQNNSLLKIDKIS